MKNKFNFILAAMFVCIAAFNTSAQNDIAEFEGEIKWSEDFKINFRVGSPDVIGQANGYVYIKRWVKRKRMIQKYNLRTLSLVSSAELELEYGKEDLSLDGYSMFGDIPVLHVSYYNKDKEETVSFLQSVNPSSLSLSKPLEVARVKHPDEKGIQLRLMKGTPSNPSEFFVSDNGTLGFVREPHYPSEIDPKEGKIAESYTGRLIDPANMEVLAESEFKLPYDRFRIMESKVGNDGLYYIAGFQLEKEVDKSKLFNREKTVYGDLEMLVLDPANGDLESFKIELDGREIERFTFKVTESGVVVSGLCSKDGSGIDGCFYIGYNAAMEETAARYYDFSQDFILKGWNEGQLKRLEKKNERLEKKGKEIEKPNFHNFYIRDLILRNNGNVTLLAEEYYVRVVTTTSTNSSGGTTTRTDYYYYYKDIIALNFDRNGELLWKTLIDKYQMSKNDDGYYSSFFVASSGNDINLVYNGRESQLEEDEDNKKVKLFQLPATIGIRVFLDESGKAKKEKLFEFEKNGMRVVPKVCGAAGEDLVFLYARSRRADKIGKIQW